MLIHPAVIVAFILYMVVGPLTVSQRSQTRFQSLGHGLHQKISSVLSLHRATFRPQDHPFASVATTVEALPITPVETSIHPAETIRAPQVPLEDDVEAVTQEVCSALHDDHPSSTSVRAFVTPFEYQGSFFWRDILSYHIFGVLAAVFCSLWFSVVTPFVFKLLSRSESRDETKPAINALPVLLPPKILAPPVTARIQISDPKSHAPLESIISHVPQESPTFWLAPEQIQQDQPFSPSPPYLCLHISTFENESQKKLSLLSSPVDSGYGVIPFDTLTAPSPVSGGSLTTTPEYLVMSLLTFDAESTLVTGSSNISTSLDDPTGGYISTAGFDSELGDDDDDDGSITITNSTVNLADPTTRSAPPPAEELVAKLERVTATLIKEAESLLEPFAEEVSVIAPHSDDSAADLPSHDEPSEATGVTVDPDYFDEMAVNGTGLKTGEVQDEVDSPSQDELGRDVRSWIPDYVIPSITITPPSEVDPEESALQLDSEYEQESEGLIDPDFWDEYESASEHNESELGSADYHSERPVTGVVVELPSSPVGGRDDPYHSPITTSGELWSDNEENDPGPLPHFGGVTHMEVFDDLDSPTLEACEVANITECLEAIDAVKETETQDSPIEDERPDTIAATSKDPTAVGTTQQLVQEPWLALEAPVREVAEPTRTELAPSTSVSFRPQSPSRTPRKHRTHSQASSDNQTRGEGSGQGRRSFESRPQYFHCCKLSRSDGRPKSWENWKLESPADCIPKQTSLQEWQFVCPTDNDSENPTTRIAIDNLDADRFRTLDGVLSYNYLTEAMGFFLTTSYRCWRGRTIEGIEYSSVGYATVDFESVGEAVRMFDELQGRRLRGHTWHWRLEFLDPRDESHGGRKIVRTELVPDSVKQALAAELEASTRRCGRPSHSDDTTRARFPTGARPQPSLGGRSLFAGAVSTVVQDRRAGEQPTKSAKRISRRPYRS